MRERKRRRRKQRERIAERGRKRQKNREKITVKPVKCMTVYYFKYNSSQLKSQWS